MTTATAPQISEEEALWRAIGAAPADALPRGVLADWFDEREGTVDCTVPTCGNPAKGWDGFYRCRTCSGTGRVSNGYAETGAALRATADRVPYVDTQTEVHSWFPEVSDDGRFRWHPESDVPPDVFNHLHSGRYDHNGEGVEWHDYPTAEAAIRDLCRAYVKVNRGRG